MTPDQVINHYGTIREAATALNVTYQCVHLWKSNAVIPEDVQFKIQVLTSGALEADQRQAQA